MVAKSFNRLMKNTGTMPEVGISKQPIDLTFSLLIPAIHLFLSTSIDFKLPVCYTFGVAKVQTKSYTFAKVQTSMLYFWCC